jgi:hypothetical protein
MARATHLHLQPDEHRLAVIRRHWWTLMRHLLWVAALLALLVAYAIVEYALPGAALARYATVLVAADLAGAGLLIFLWTVRDLPAWWAERLLVTDQRVIERRGIFTVRQREAPLRSIHPGATVAAGLGARLLRSGTLVLRVEDRGTPMVLVGIPRVEVVRAWLTTLSEEARQGYLQARQGVGGPVQAALTSIVTGKGGPPDAPTLVLEPITPMMLLAQHRAVLQPGETVLYATRRHRGRPLAGTSLVLVASLVVVVAVMPWHLPLAAFWFAVGCLPAWTSLLWWRWRARLYVLTCDRLLSLDSTWLFGHQEELAYLRDTAEVELKVSALGSRLADRGSLILHPRQGAPVTLSALPEPDRVKRLIFAAMETAAEGDRLRDQARQAGMLTEWFEEYHRLRSAP